jgi:cell shape-determining protein MreD
MKSFLFYLVFLIISLVLEMTIRHFPLVSIRIDLVWLSVVYLGFFVPVEVGGPAVFLIGLTEEAIGVPLHGILPLTYLIFYFFLRVTHQNLFFERGASQIIWVVLLTLAQKGLEQGLLFWQGYGLFFDPWTVIPSALLGGFVSLYLFPFLKRGVTRYHAS